MTSIRVHLLSLIPPAFLAIGLGFHPGFLVAMVVGVLLPEVDTIDPRIHRSWFFHTFLPVALVYQVLSITGLLAAAPVGETILHFVTVGVLFHLLFDFVYPKRKTHEGAEWPVRPTIWSAPWGLMWMGLSWLVQWFAYLSIAFLPWVFGIPA